MIWKEELHNFFREKWISTSRFWWWKEFRVPSADEKCRREIKQKRIAANQKTIKIKQNTEVQTIGQEFLRRDVEQKGVKKPFSIPSLDVFFMREPGGGRPLFYIQSSSGFPRVLPGFPKVFPAFWKCPMGTETGGPASSQKYHRNQCPKGEDEHCNLAWICYYIRIIC